MTPTLDEAARDLAEAVLRGDKDLGRSARVVLAALDRRRKAGAQSGKAGGRPRRWRAAYANGLWAAVDGLSGDVVATYELTPGGGRVRQLSGLKNVTAQRVVRREVSLAAARARSAAVLAARGPGKNFLVAESTISCDIDPAP